MNKISNIFNNHFVAITLKMSNKIKNHNQLDPKLPKYNHSNTNPLISLINYDIIDDTTIIKVINSLKNNTTLSHES